VLAGPNRPSYIDRDMSDLISRSPDALRHALEKAGWRYTRQRAAVYAYLIGVTSHPSADEVFEAVRQDIPNLSLATVYKALEALVDAGVAVKLPSSAGPARYDGRLDGHYHVRCLRTGQLRDMPTPFDPHLLDKLDPGLVEALSQHGFHVTNYRLEVVGYFEDADGTGFAAAE
jgi:Fe2+ or Zn2+ uptake regulation protein